MQRRLVGQRACEFGVATIRARPEPGEGGEQPVAQDPADSDDVVRRPRCSSMGARSWPAG